MRPAGTRAAVARARATDGAGETRGQKTRAMLRARLGDDIFSSWFHTLEFESFEAKTVKVSVPVKFLRTWIQSHYADDLLACCRAEFKGAEKVDVVLRQPGGRAAARADGQAATAPARSRSTARARVRVAETGNRGCRHHRERRRRSAGPASAASRDRRSIRATPSRASSSAPRTAWRTPAPRRSPTRRWATSQGFNPLYIHSSVGLGKTHLLHAIAWEVKRRAPHAQVLYLTAERFRYQFVEALRSQDPLAFKEKFRAINILLIDDLEFMHGERTEQEFDHIINSLLDGGRQVVVASARAPNHVERLNERMRSRLQRGLVTEIGALDHDLRLKVLEKRLSEKRALDPSFALGREILELLAERLTESGRELEGAVTRLYATWQYMRTSITPDVAETVIRDLVHGLEPRRIKIEDILRIISRHFGVSKGDLLSQRRHRSVVWPRQVGMYLAKQLTARSLPEIGRRFGNRDHTTVLHAIRKIEGELTDNPRLKEELEELKKLLEPLTRTASGWSAVLGEHGGP